MEFGGVLDDHEPIVTGKKSADRVQQRGLPRTRPAADQDRLVVFNSLAYLRECRGRRHSGAHEFVCGEKAVLKLSDRERRPTEAAWWKDGGNTRAVFQPSVENRLRLGDVITQRTRDVLDGDAEVAFVQVDVFDGDQLAFSLNEDAPRTVHHDLADFGIGYQMRNGAKEWEDELEGH